MGSNLTDKLILLICSPMKAVLASLLCFVLLESQVFAIHGGPSDITGVTTSVTGTYSGALLSNGAGSNSLGVFSFSAPASGFGSGSFFIFAGGSFYQGAIAGIVDPGELSLKTLIHGVRITTLSASNGGVGGG